jgi:hypothetical protein
MNEQVLILSLQLCRLLPGYLGTSRTQHQVQIAGWVEYLLDSRSEMLTNTKREVHYLSTAPS